MLNFNETISSSSLFMLMFKKEKQAKKHIKEVDNLPGQIATILSSFF